MAGCSCSCAPPLPRGTAKRASVQARGRALAAQPRAALTTTTHGKQDQTTALHVCNHFRPQSKLSHQKPASPYTTAMAACIARSASTAACAKASSQRPAAVASAVSRPATRWVGQSCVCVCLPACWCCGGVECVWCASVWGWRAHRWMGGWARADRGPARVDARTRADAACTRTQPHTHGACLPATPHTHAHTTTTGCPCARARPPHPAPAPSPAARWRPGPPWSSPS